MSLFFRVVSVEKAQDVIRSITAPVPPETVPLVDAFGRVLARECSAREDIPGFDRPVVDGYAVIAADTHGATDAVPSMLRNMGRVEMGQLPAHTVVPGTCLVIPTGAVLPPGADAVVMAEQTEESGNLVLVKKAVAAGENVLRRGEDFSAGQKVLDRGRILSPQDLGVLAALGFTSVCCSRRPIIGVISTGNEVVPVDATPATGQVRDVNTYLCTAFLQRHGCTARQYGIVRDTPQEFVQVLERAAAECEAVLISGGSSKDVRDMVSAGIALHGEVLVHGIGIQPGKPTIIGKTGSIPVIGLPGHPASAFIVLLAIVRPLIAALSGRRDTECRVPARLTQNIPSVRGRVDYVRVRVADGRATPLFGKSGLLNTLIESDGVVSIGADREGVEAGEEVEVIRW